MIINHLCKYWKKHSIDNFLKIAFCALSFRNVDWYFLKNLIFNFVQFGENVAKYQTIINNKQAKILNTVKNNYKQNKQANRQTNSLSTHPLCFTQCIIKSLIIHDV